MRKDQDGLYTRCSRMSASLRINNLISEPFMRAFRTTIVVDDFIEIAQDMFNCFAQALIELYTLSICIDHHGKSWLDFEFTRLYAMSYALARSYDSFLVP